MLPSDLREPPPIHTTTMTTRTAADVTADVTVVLARSQTDKAKKILLHCRNCSGSKTSCLLHRPQGKTLSMTSYKMNHSHPYGDTHQPGTPPPTGSSSLPAASSSAGTETKASRYKPSLSPPPLLLPCDSAPLPLILGVNQALAHLHGSRARLVTSLGH